MLSHVVFGDSCWRLRIFNNGGTGSSEILLKLPITAAAGLPRDDEIAAWYECDELTTTAAFRTSICGNALTAAAALRIMSRRQFPAVRKDLRIQVPTQHPREQQLHHGESLIGVDSKDRE